LIRSLGQVTRPARAAELRGKPGLFRLCLDGRWRIVYQVVEDLQRVRILRVRRKEQIDYESLEVTPSEQP
jgi:plasmid stabilization system protein ParE